MVALLTLNTKTSDKAVNNNCICGTANVAFMAQWYSYELINRQNRKGFNLNKTCGAPNIRLFFKNAKAKV